MKKEIKELASDNVLMSAYLILEDAKQIKANLAMELDLARDRRLAQEREFREFMDELRDTLTKVQAQFKVEAQLLNLIKPQAGEKENETSFMARFTK
jgi:hypothetical protein